MNKIAISNILISVVSNLFKHIHKLTEIAGSFSLERRGDTSEQDDIHTQISCRKKFWHAVVYKYALWGGLAKFLQEIAVDCGFRLQDSTFKQAKIDY